MHSIRVVAAFLTLAGLSLPSQAAESTNYESHTFKIKIERDGAYRLDFAALVAAGHDAGPLASESLGMTRRGEALPIWVADGDDGEFGPGDWIEFLGEHLRGEISYFDEHTRYNVYWLHADAETPLRMNSRPDIAPVPAPEGLSPGRLMRRVHHEDDALLIRLPRAGTDGSQELWFWQRLVQGHDPTSHTLTIPDLARPGLAAATTGATTTAAAGPSEAAGVKLRLEMRGWSRPRGKGDETIADHVLDVRLNGKALPTQSWDGPEVHLIELDVPLERWVAGANALELAVPKRFQTDKKLLVDVILLNWIEVEYPHSGRLAEPQVAVEVLPLVPPLDSSRLVSLSSSDSDASSKPLLVYGAESRRELHSDDEGVWRFTAEAGEDRWLALEPSGIISPASVELDRASRLTATDRQADYLMISHRQFMPSLGPLVELHESLGRRVALIDVEDVYDEFNDGIVHPQALRDFVSHAYHHWQDPAPRFVLLVGDSSWDGKSERAIDQNYADWTFRRHERDRFAKNGSTLYEEGADLNRRNFIPTWGYGTGEGHAASDNYFVAVDGDDSLPDLAIGRFTVAAPEEVADIVSKTVRYVRQQAREQTSRQAPPQVRQEARSDADGGDADWNRKILFITNEEEKMQMRSERVVQTVAEQGFEPLKVYPESTEQSNEANTSRLLEAFDGGLLAVQFLGHGGRYIWRTGPPDLKKNHDLFTLDDLDRLTPTTHLPVVLSLTCYSAPFDHPNADSIGEKLLRLPEQGAIGVIAASWRNSPSPRWGQALMTELTTPGATVGESMMKAKHQARNHLFVQTYNLLGDPGVPVALPDFADRVSTERSKAESSTASEGKASAPR